MKRHLLLIAASLRLATAAGAAVPPPDKLLPDDTLVMFSVPDYAKACAAYETSPQTALWRDPAMKAFKDKFMAKFSEDIVKPLERDLGIQFANYAGLAQGQVTFALVKAGWEGKDGQTPAVMFLVDTRDKSGQLKTNLAELRKKWVDAGKTLKTEKIRDVEFSLVTLTSNDMPKLLQKALPSPAANEKATDADAEKPAAKEPAKAQLYIGQSDSLLVIGNSPKGIEKVLARMAGGTVPALADVPTFASDQVGLFRDALVIGWVNTKQLMEVLLQLVAKEKQGDEGAGSLMPAPDKIVSALGLTGVKSLAFSVRDSAEGSMAQLFVAAPESARQGLVQILAGEPKETLPPPFVPADAMKFQRWRIDGQKSWATLEKALSSISPQILNTVNFIMDSASQAAKEKDPDFDLKKNLIGNLGDDIISYAKAPKGSTLEELNAAPALVLIGSPKPEQLANAIRTLLGSLGQAAGGAPKEREFLGRKIYTLPLPPMPGGSKTPGGVSYASSGGYLAISTEPSMIEEYLRSGESQGKSLGGVSGLKEATAKVTGPGTSMFGYDNQAEGMRVLVEVLRKDTNALSGLNSFAAIPGGPGAATVQGGLKINEWIDVSLLPSFDRIAKYFSFSVYGLSATADGLSLKLFTPTPPEAKK